MVFPTTENPQIIVKKQGILKQAVRTIRKQLESTAKINETFHCF
jgi:hypothetical protein